MNEEIVQKVRNPNATKALINKLNLKQKFIIKIKSLSSCGQTSDYGFVEYLPMWSPTETNESDNSSANQFNQITRL